ncbi:MAG: glycosyltransferase family 4 protein [Chloroflexota bacterium]
MKIALISPYDFAYPGGVANHITSLCHNLSRMGHDVKVIAPASRAVPSIGSGFIPIGTPRPVPASGSIVRTTLSLWLSSKVKNILDREKFDVLHLHEPFVPMLNYTMLRLSDTVNIGTFHSCGSRLSYNIGWPITTILMRRLARKLNGKIAVSEPAMNYVGRYVPGPYEIIPNGVDLQHFSGDITPISEFCDGKQNILFVGRLERRKGLNYLLRAYYYVKQKVPNSRLIIVGPGTMLRRNYEKWIKNHNLKDVVFTGFVPYADLPRYYQTADIFCAPATGRESFGIVLLEAMALGKPVVATNIAGYASVLTDNEEGLLVTPKDGNSLAQALISLLGDKALRQQMGAKGKAKAREYSWENVAQKVYNFYLKSINNSSRSQDS